jgi:hypothetical protein
MVDSVLYMWVRNTGNAQIAWSADRGRTWQWGIKFDTSFGSPAFLNFGKNYAGARDGYVYTYSQDGPSAYEASDGILLARVPKNRIRQKESWEYFAGHNTAGSPQWTRDIARRGHVLAYPGMCERVDAAYNAPLGRYLLTVSHGHNGAWSIFDAPEPWGPWTVAFHTGNWGLGRTHGYRLSTKWMSRDGRSMWLVFSGARSAVEPNYDAFCLRRFEIEAPGRRAEGRNRVAPAGRLSEYSLRRFGHAGGGGTGADRTVKSIRTKSERKVVEVERKP